MTLDQIIQDIILKMSNGLDGNQLRKLQNVLYVSFKGKELKDVSYELTVAEQDADAIKIKEFIQAKKVGNRCQSTLRQYVRELWDFRNVINKPFDEVTSRDLREYFAYLQENRRISIVTLQNKKQYLNSFYKFCYDEGYVKFNPVAKIESFKLPKVIKHEFSTTDMESMKISCSHPRDRALIEFLYATGIRVSELCSLNVGDLDMAKQEFMVIGKGRKQRKCYFNESCNFYLFRYLSWRMKSCNITLDELQNQPLFCSITGKKGRITAAGVRGILKRIGKQADVSHVHPHRFRRTFATDLIQKGMRIEEVMLLMGHEKIDTTMIYYDLSKTNVHESYVRIAA